MSVWDIDSVGPLSCGSHVKEEVDEARSRIRARISIRSAEWEKEKEKEWERKRQRFSSTREKSRGKEKYLNVSCACQLCVIIIDKTKPLVFPDQNFASMPRGYCQRFVLYQQHAIWFSRNTLTLIWTIYFLRRSDFCPSNLTMMLMLNILFYVPYFFTNKLTYIIFSKYNVMYILLH